MQNLSDKEAAAKVAQIECSILAAWSVGCTGLRFDALHAAKALLARINDIEREFMLKRFEAAAETDERESEN